MPRVPLERVEVDQQLAGASESSRADGINFASQALHNFGGERMDGGQTDLGEERQAIEFREQSAAATPAPLCAIAGRSRAARPEASRRAAPSRRRPSRVQRTIRTKAARRLRSVAASQNASTAAANRRGACADGSDRGSPVPRSSSVSCRRSNAITCGELGVRALRLAQQMKSRRRWRRRAR